MTEVLDDNLIRTNNGKVVVEKNKTTFTFSNISVEELGKQIAEIFIGKGYKLEEGNNANGKYGKGSTILRVLFGAFAKRFCWQVIIDAEGRDAKLALIKDAKGYAGGVIGVNQVNNEFKRMSDLFITLQANY